MTSKWWFEAFSEDICGRFTRLELHFPESPSLLATREVETAATRIDHFLYTRPTTLTHHSCLALVVFDLGAPGKVNALRHQTKIPQAKECLFKSTAQQWSSPPQAWSRPPSAGQDVFSMLMVQSTCHMRPSPWGTSKSWFRHPNNLRDSNLQGAVVGLMFHKVVKLTWILFCTFVSRVNYNH